MTGFCSENEMIELTQDMITELVGVGERYSWMDDSWPDMEDDMAILLSDEFGIDDDEAYDYVKLFIRNCHKYR